MTRRIYNWTYRDVKQFLKEHGFEFYKPLRGSHEQWIKLGEDGTPDRIVEVNFTHEAYPPKTLKIMIYQSGIPQSDWSHGPIHERRSTMPKPIVISLFDHTTNIVAPWANAGLPIDLNRLLALS